LGLEVGRPSPAFWVTVDNGNKSNRSEEGGHGVHRPRRKGTRGRAQPLIVVLMEGPGRLGLRVLASPNKAKRAGSPEEKKQGP